MNTCCRKNKVATGTVLVIPKCPECTIFNTWCRVQDLVKGKGTNNDFISTVALHGGTEWAFHCSTHLARVQEGGSRREEASSEPAGSGAERPVTEGSGVNSLWLG
ncbi:hypothetical protein AALO_G00088430 [Alosa alosa]|uniref:Uncharacterized protein n=1 Tax=Alosa alosa TaxID=278164 RepID=A0AAV6H029_9TELE|nr:hypothetical protein AALO_G00088430 [Alosa alosa]